MANFLEDENFKKMEPNSEEPDNSEPMTVALFTELMAHFYHLGWMKGTGGAMGVISGKDHLLISPSALQKERLQETDVYIFDIQSKSILQKPKNPAITVSSCAPLFSHIMNATGFRCVLHSHSIYSNLVTQLVKSKTFEISHQEYIKGIFDPFTGKNMKYHETLVIPIIDNKPSESLLLPGLEAAMLEYPQSIAVLVRNHGLFVWGPTWQEAKIQMECIDYLLELASKMLEKGLPLVKTDDDSSPVGISQSESSYQFSFSNEE